MAATWHYRVYNLIYIRRLELTLHEYTRMMVMRGGLCETPTNPKSPKSPKRKRNLRTEWVRR